MAFNVFYSMVKEYAEELVNKNSSFVPAADAKLCALLTSSHDIIAGVTSISLYNGSVSAIPAEYMAAVAMNNIGQTRVLRMITISLADFSVVTPQGPELELISSFDPDNIKCEVFVSASESVTVASLIGAVIPPEEPAEEQSEEAAPVYGEEAPAVQDIPEQAEAAPAAAEEVPAPEEAPAEPEITAEEIPENEQAEEANASEATAEEVTPEQEAAEEPVSEEPSEVQAVEEAEDAPEQEDITETEPVSEAPEAEEAPSEAPAEKPETPSAQMTSPSFFSGFGDDDDFVGTPADPAEMEKMGFIRNSAPKHHARPQEAPVPNDLAPPAEYSQGFNVDESNPFYEAEGSAAPKDNVVYFAELHDKENDSAAADNRPVGAMPSQVQEQAEELSMDELLKQAKKRKKIAKANFNFRKK